MDDRASRLLRKRLYLGLGLSLAYAAVLYLLIWQGNGGMLFISGLIFMPMAIASVFSAVADPLGRASIGTHLKWALIGIAVLLVLSIIVFREGGICVAMAAPFFFAGAALGSSLTVALLRKRALRHTPPLMILAPLLLAPFEPHLDYRMVDEQVVSIIEIDAPRADVWAQTVEIRDIRRPELKPTFSHNVVGVPTPVNARMEGQGVGAVRQLRWTKGVRFEEVVTAWDQDRRLAWDFRFGPDSIPDAVEAHIDVDSSYLKLARGDYVLEDLPNNRTRLTLTTRYRMATPINAYCALWGKIFLNDFHSTVLKVIKDRSEAQA